MKLKHNYVLLISLLILSVLGFVTLLSTSIDLDGNIHWEGIISKHLVFILVGTLLYILAWRIDYTYLQYIPVIGAIVGGVILLLVLTKVFGPRINGVQRWLVVGGIQIQPSEIAKIAVIIMVAAILALREKYNEWLLAGVSAFTLLIILVLVYIEPHGSMSVIIFTTWFLIMFTFMKHQVRNSVLLFILLSSIAGIVLISLGQASWGIIAIFASAITWILGMYSQQKWRVLFISTLIVGLLVGGVVSVGWNSILKDYQKERITSFLAEDTEDCANCFNVNQSKVAIGSGGIWGKGFGYGTQSRLKFLPEHQTDFIYATYAEQFGLVGSFFLLSIYGVIIFTILYYSMKVKGDLFASMILFGIAVKLILEVFINVGTNVGVIPATGSPLPLMSAGGSITLMTFFSIGLVQSIIARHVSEPQTNDFIDNDELLI